MLVKEITYTDFNGEERTEKFYFNLTKSELLEKQLTHPGGYVEYLERIIAAKDQVLVVEAFRDLILDSYGEKSEDGKRFVKSKTISEGFHQSEAYSELFMSLISDPDAAAAFVRGIIPKMELTEEQQATLAARTKQLIDTKKIDA